MENIDRDHIWHPFARQNPVSSNLLVERAHGAHLYTESGALLDLISSWWVSIHGHSNQEIADAIHKQCTTLDHVIFSGFWHEPAVSLVRELRPFVAPYRQSNLSHYFFSDNGSTAVEIAIKMAYQYHYNIVQTYAGSDVACSEMKDRDKVIVFLGCYHGDTFGCMSVSNAGYHDLFRPLCFDVHVLDWPEYYIGCDMDALLVQEDSMLQSLEHACETSYALIIEPLIQGASGMHMMRPECLKKIVEIAHQHDVFVIFDEVMTGFYRTGKFFAMDHIRANDHLPVIDVSEPDIVCISKALTGGVMPMALTIASGEIYSAFVSLRKEQMLAHGHSYTANPLGCAAGLKSLEILQRPENLQNLEQIIRVQEMGVAMLSERCASHVHKLRHFGVIVAWDMGSVQCAQQVVRMLYERGILLRNLGPVLYILPPYCVDPQELLSAYSSICDVIYEICN